MILRRDILRLFYYYYYFLCSFARIKLLVVEYSTAYIITSTRRKVVTDYIDMLELQVNSNRKSLSLLFQQLFDRVTAELFTLQQQQKNCEKNYYMRSVNYN